MRLHWFLRSSVSAACSSAAASPVPCHSGRTAMPRKRPSSGLTVWQAIVPTISPAAEMATKIDIKALLKAFWRQHCVFICAARVAAFVALEGRAQAAKNATAVVHRRQADRECRLLERLIRRRLLPTGAFPFQVCGHAFCDRMTPFTRHESERQINACRHSSRCRHPLMHHKTSTLLNRDLPIFSQEV